MLVPRLAGPLSQAQAIREKALGHHLGVNMEARVSRARRGQPAKPGAHRVQPAMAHEGPPGLLFTMHIALPLLFLNHTSLMM